MSADNGRKPMNPELVEVLHHHVRLRVRTARRSVQHVHEDITRLLDEVADKPREVFSEDDEQNVRDARVLLRAATDRLARLL